MIKGAGDDMRFSDEELHRFRDEFRQHMLSYQERVRIDDERHRLLLELQGKNTAQLESLISNTKEIVEVYADIKGAARIGMAAQKFGLWLAKWGIIGTMFAAIYGYIIKHFPPGT